MEFFATAAKGTEPALRDELRMLGLRRIRADRGGVHFEGPWADGWRACLESRVAVRVLVPLGSFEAPNAEALYEGVRGIEWQAHVSAQHTIAVGAASRASSLVHTQFIAQKTKDAIVDQLRDATGTRPSVDLRDPDVRVFVHLAKDHATVYLDLAGEPLHRRGYRGEGPAAPLKETLAAALVLLSGWRGDSPFVDPLCGSGTIAIEADLLARRVAPGLARARFGFERWASFDDAAARDVAALRERARAGALPAGPEVFAADVDGDAVDQARANAMAAGAHVRFAQKALFDLEPPAPSGCLVTNPPYGVRLDLDPELLTDLPAALGRMRGYRVGLLAGAPELEHAMRMRSERYYDVLNGDIPCRFLIYDVPATGPRGRSGGYHGRSQRGSAR